MEENETQPGGFYTPRALFDVTVEWLVTNLDPIVIDCAELIDGQHRLGRVTRELIPSRLHVAADGMRTATSAEERRQAAREFLNALAELIARLIGFLVRLLLRLLSGLLGRTTGNDLPVWAPMPLERTPEVIPRGPNPAFPVNIMGITAVVRRGAPYWLPR
ncbi:hypothetical protein ACFCXR_30645 [Streptomyces noursei]|uniref:hypothetical protein n=1 Tax=Streptomyces noursei TaxID=1971 RepID=UPI0035DC8160